jgi:3-deoxy-7-phosphoheptulonate synthase
VEVHHDPDHALSDGAQSLFPQQFAELMDQLRMIARAVGRSIANRPAVKSHSAAEHGPTMKIPPAAEPGSAV